MGESFECDGSGRRGRAVLGQERRVQCNMCQRVFIRQAKRGYWLPFHDDRPDTDGPSDPVPAGL